VELAFVAGAVRLDLFFDVHKVSLHEVVGLLDRAGFFRRSREGAESPVNDGVS
jgi:hypothetical protein